MRIYAFIIMLPEKYTSNQQHLNNNPHLRHYFIYSEAVLALIFRLICSKIVKHAYLGSEFKVSDKLKQEAKLFDATKCENLISAFGCLIIIATLVFVPTQTLSPPLSPLSFITWLAITALTLFLINKLKSADESEYEYFKERIMQAIPISNTLHLKESRTALWLVNFGMLVWLLLLVTKANYYGLGLLIIGAVAMIWGFSIQLEANGIYRAFNSYVSNKWILGVCSSALLFFSGVESASQINAVFGVDSSLFPFTVTAMLVINICVIFCLMMLIIFAITVCIVGLQLISDLRRKPKTSSSPMIFVALLFFSTYASLAGLIIHPSEAKENIARKIALKIDFNSSHLCTNSELKNRPVIFLGPNLSRVLAQSEKDEKTYQVYQCVSFSQMTEHTSNNKVNKNTVESTNKL
ncbi:hypothetical protein [Pseudoalteromonas maricaloris]